MKNPGILSKLFSALPLVLTCSLLAGEEPVSVLGYLEPYRSISMNAAEPGVIDAISVSEGESVKEGQPLLNLNLRVLEAQLSIAKIQAQSTGEIDLAAAELAVARDRHEKLIELKRSGTAHSTELARAEADLKKAEAQLNLANEARKIAEYRVAEINAEIELRILRSPITGVVLEINREIAESATAPQEGQPNKPLVKLAQIDRLRLVFHAPANQASSLVTGQKLKVRVLGQSSLSPDREENGIETEGTIEFVSPSIDPATETIRTRLVIDNAGGRLKSGAHALVFLGPRPASSPEP